MSADVTFFEYVRYFSSDSPGILSACVPLSSPELILDATAPRSQSEYTEICTKTTSGVHLTSKSSCLAAPSSGLDNSSPIAGPPLSHSLPPSDLDVPITL